MPPVRYLITGGSGYIGSRLTEILAARDDVEEIVAPGRSSTREPAGQDHVRAWGRA